MVKGGLHVLNRNGHRVVAIEAKNDGQVGAVAGAGFGQRTVEIDLYGYNVVKIAVAAQLAQKTLGSPPGAHGVRTAGADAHLENVENGDAFHGVKGAEKCGN